MTYKQQWTNARTVKKCVPWTLKPLLELVNASITGGSFPATLKTVVKPIYKKGVKEDPNNYRPITLLPALSKILEKANFFSRHTTYLINLSLDVGKINP